MPTADFVFRPRIHEMQKVQPTEKNLHYLEVEKTFVSVAQAYFLRSCVDLFAIALIRNSISWPTGLAT